MIDDMFILSSCIFEYEAYNEHAIHTEEYLLKGSSLSGVFLFVLKFFLKIVDKDNFIFCGFFEKR